MAKKFSLIQKIKGKVTYHPIGAFQLYTCGLYVMLETSQQLNLDRDKKLPKVRVECELEEPKDISLQVFIKTYCVGGCHAPQE